MVLSALVIAAAIAEGGDEVAQPFFLGAIVFVVLIFVGIGSVYFGKKSGNDRPWHFAIASFVPISWLGAVLVGFNIAIRISNGKLWSLIAFSALMSFFLMVLVMRKMQLTNR